MPPRRRTSAPPPPVVRSSARALGVTLSEKYGGGARLIAPEDPRRPRVITTGVDALDVALGIGGWAEGRVAILHGAEACGKSTVALHTIAAWQRAGAVACYFDWERKLVVAYAESLGVDMSAMVYLTPPYLERGFSMMQAAAEAHRAQDRESPLVFVWDSLQAATAKMTMDREYDEDAFSPETRAYSRCLAKVVPSLSDHRALLIMISQVRMRIGGIGRPQQKVGVGNAPLFYASTICQFRPGAAKPGADGLRAGEETSIIIRKHQLDRPWRVAKFALRYGEGVEVGSSVLNAALAVGLAEKTGKGAWYVLHTPAGLVKVQGAGGVRDFHDADPAGFQAYRDSIRAHIGQAPAPEAPPDVGEDDELEELDAS